jgi:hypothetical protein
MRCALAQARRDAHATVAHLDGDGFAIALPAQVNAGTRVRIFHGIFQQVAHGRRERLSVRANRDVWSGI